MKALLKKAVGTVLVLGMIGSMAACSNGSKSTGTSTASTSSTSSASQPVTLTEWDQSTGNTDPTTTLIPKLVTQWNSDHPNIKVVRTGIPEEQFKTKIKTALAANEAPDVFYGMGGGSFMQPYIQAGDILDIDSYVDSATKAKIRPGMINGCEVNGKLYTLPCYTFIASLYCNTALFSKAGAKIPTNFDELLDAVKKLHAANITPALIGEKDRWPGMYWYDIIAMREAGNSEVMSAFKDPSKFNSPDFIKAAYDLQELAKAGAFNSSLFSLSYDEMLGEYNNGSAAMMFQANWVNPGIEADTAATKGKVVAITFPTIEGGKGNASEFYGGGQDGFYVSNSTKSPKQAVDFLSYFSEQLGLQGYLVGAGLPCWNTDGLDTSKLSSLDQTDAKMLTNATSFVTWWDNILPADSSDTHYNLVAELLANSITPQQFGEQMSKVNATQLTF